MDSMCKVKCKVNNGLVESEKVVLIRTIEGHEEEVTVSAAEVSDNTVEAGLIGVRDGKALIELSRESASGHWRLWVPEGQLVR